MLYLFLLLLIYGLQIGPPLVFERASRRNASHRPDFKYTGAELARLLLDKHGLSAVAVELLPANITDFGDCYDPVRRVVRLSGNVMNQRSVTAYAIAAHEVGHAVQHAEHDGSMVLQRFLVYIVRGAIVLLIGGVLFLVLFSERMGGREQWHWLNTAVLTTYFGCAIALRLVTLPVEWSASFDHVTLASASEGDLRVT